MRKLLKTTIVVLALVVSVSLAQGVFASSAAEKAAQRAQNRTAQPAIERVEPSSIVTSVPAPTTPERAALVESLKAARRAGDQARADRIMALLSPPTAEPSPPKGVNVPRVEFASADSHGGFGSRYGSDVLVADLANVEGHPDMTTTASGKAFIAIESMNSLHAWIFRSLDGGATWSLYIVLEGQWGEDIEDPSITVPEYAEDYLFLAYEYNDTIQVMRVRLSDKTVDFYNVQYNVLEVGRPRIVTDNHDWNGYYVYVAYVSGTLLKAQGDAFEVWSARSTDKGATWGAKHSFYIPDFSDPTPRPDIAYGEDVVYMVWDEEVIGPSTEMNVYVSRSTDYGSTWSAKTCLSDTTAYSCFDPRVAAIQDGDEVVVAYTKDYTTDTDVWQGYSTDAGANWSVNHGVGATANLDEERPDLCVSESLGEFHIVYWDEYNITYEHAPYTSISFSDEQTVNDTGDASRAYHPPTVAVDFPSGQAGAAWSDFGDADYSILFDRADWFAANDPVPDVKVNGVDGPLNLGFGANLEVKLSLDPGAGGNADWWVLVNSPFGWFRYNPGTGSWVPGFGLAHQGPLFALNSVSVFNGAGLPVGNYTFYFGVDMVMDGNLDMAATFYDLAQVHVQ